MYHFNRVPTAPSRQLFSTRWLSLRDDPGIPFLSVKTSGMLGFFVCSLEIIYPAVQPPQYPFFLVSPSVFPQPILILTFLASCPIDPAVMEKD